jgi:peptide deformylase
MIVRYPNDILSTKCRDVEVTLGVVPALSESTQHLICRMLEVLHETGGVGLAAPQVGSNQRIIIVDVHAGQDGLSKKPVVMINPVITKRSNKYQADIEECLSIPGRRFKVFRPKSVWISYTNSSGVRITQHFVGGYQARVVQHEIDHLKIADRGTEAL